MQKTRRLQDEYRFPGFRPQAAIKGIFGDSHARVVVLKRRKKKRFVRVAKRFTGVSTTSGYERFGIFRAVGSGYFWSSRCGVWNAASAGK